MKKTPDDMMIEKSGVQKLKTSRRVSLGSSCVYVYAALSACAFCSAYACGETEFFLSVLQHSVLLLLNGNYDHCSDNC